MPTLKTFHNRRWGITEGYPTLRRLIGRLSDYLSLFRPFTLSAPFLVGVFGSAICLGSTFWTEWTKVVYVSLTLAFCQGVGQCINQAVGVDEDRVNKPYRPIPSGRATVEEAYGLAFLLSLFAVGRAFTINAAFGVWILTILFFAVFYNLKPFQVRKYLWVNLLWMAVSRGLLPFTVVWSAYGSPFTLKPWLLGSVAFLWVFGFQATKDLGDVEGDQRFGIRTLPVAYGVEKTKTMIKYLSLLPFTPLVWYVHSGLLPLSYLLLINLALVREVGLWGFGRRLSFAENDVSWLCFYIGLGLIFILSYIAELL